MGQYTEEVAILSIAIIEGVALILGEDGAFILPLTTMIAGIAGYKIGQKRAKN